MPDNQLRPTPNQKNSKIKWIALTIGGCIVTIACLGLASILVIRFFNPQIGVISSQIMSGLNGRPEVSQ